MCIALMFGENAPVENNFENFPFNRSYLLAKNRYIWREAKKRETELLKVSRPERGYMTFGFSSGASRNGMIMGINEKALMGMSLISHGIRAYKLPRFLQELLESSKDSNEFLQNGVDLVKNEFFPPSCGGILLSMDKEGLGGILEINGKNYDVKTVSEKIGYSNCYKGMPNVEDDILKYPKMRERKVRSLLGECQNLSSVIGLLSDHGNPRICRHKEEGWKYYTRSVRIAYNVNIPGIISFDGPPCRTQPHIYDLKEYKLKLQA